MVKFYTLFAKLALVLSLLILFSGFVYGLDCQYKEMKIYSEIVNYSRVDGVEYGMPFIEIKNFAQSSRQGDRYITYSTSPTKFTVFNNYVENITIDLRYIVDGQTKQKILEIAPKWYETISYRYPKNIVEDTITFQILEPGNIKQGTEEQRIMRPICKECLGDTCLDDGAPCNSLYDDEKCGSGICNIAGFCGPTKIVDCPSGKLNCDDKICLKPSTKEVGEGYMCSFECKSDRFEDGKCLISSYDLKRELEKEEQARIREEEARKKEKQDNLKKTVIFIVIMMLIISISLYYFRTKTAIKGIRKKQEKIIKETEMKKEEIENQIKNLKNNIKSKKEQVSKLENERQGLINRRNDIQELNEQIKALTKKQKIKNEELKRVGEEGEEYLKKVTKPFPDPQANNQLVIINPHLGGYKCFYKKELNLEDYPISTLLHRWIWKKHHGRWPKHGYHIHHIDGDKYNNKIENLEEIEGEEHFELHRNRYK